MLCRYELDFVVRVGGEKPYGCALSLSREPQRWGRELDHRSGHLELYPSESTSPKMVFPFLCSSSFISLLQSLPFLRIFLILVTFIFLIGAWAGKREQVLHLSCHTLGWKGYWREVKCAAAGTVSVCVMGVLMEPTMGHFSSLENKHSRREDEIFGAGGGGGGGDLRTTAVTQILISRLLHAFIQTLLLL